MRGVNIEYTVRNKKETFAWEPGASVLNRTIDNNTMSSIVGVINAQPLDRQFYPRYNVYIFNYYNTIRFKDFVLYTEFCRKTPEAIFDFISNGQPLLLRKGKVLFGSLSYTKTLKPKKGIIQR